jgi:hypothetical protein
MHIFSCVELSILITEMYWNLWNSYWTCLILNNRMNKLCIGSCVPYYRLSKDGPFFKKLPVFSWHYMFILLTPIVCRILNITYTLFVKSKHVYFILKRGRMCCIYQYFLISILSIVYLKAEVSRRLLDIICFLWNQDNNSTFLIISVCTRTVDYTTLLITHNYD